MENETNREIFYRFLDNRAFDLTREVRECWGKYQQLKNEAKYIVRTAENVGFVYSRNVLGLARMTKEPEGYKHLFSIADDVIKAEYNYSKHAGRQMVSNLRPFFEALGDKVLVEFDNRY